MDGVPVDDKLKAIPAAIAASASGVLAAIAAGGTPGTAVAGASAQIAFQGAVAIRQRWISKSTRAIEVAAEALDVGVDIVLDRAIQYDDRLELLTRVIEASARSTIPEKIAALGRVLAHGLSDHDAHTAEALVLARALEMLEPSHVTVLVYLQQYPLPPQELLGQDVRAIAGWQVPVLCRVLPTVAPVMDPVVAALSGAGLIRDQTGVNLSSMPGPEAWVITPTGRSCLDLLDSDDSNSEDAPSPHR